VVSALVVTSAVVTAPAAFADTPDPNPSIPRQCGLGVTLVLDASGSVQSSNAVGAVRSAADAFLDAFVDTGSTARVLQFASLSEELAPRQIIDDVALAPGGALSEAVAGYYNPIPPRPGNVTIRRFTGGSITSSGSFSTSNASNQYTNWQQVLTQAATDAGDYVIFITDGDPTAYDFGEAGDPYRAPDVAVGTDRTTAAAAETLDRAVTSANDVKANGARVLAVGVGAALQNSASVQRLTQVSGPNVVTDMADFNALTTDVALVRDFEDLADAVRTLVLDLCSPSLTIRKFAQSADNAAYEPAPGWDVTVTPTVPGGSFDWVLPNGATGPSSTVVTNADGFAQFQWEPDPGDSLSNALVSEALQPGFIAGRPNADDYRCEFRNSDGDVRTVSGEFTSGPDGPQFSLTGISAEIGTCSIFNSFDYAPDIALTKVNDPTVARGDLTPGALVTSDYRVTNPGNTPLHQIEIIDDRCAAVTPVLLTDDINIGDVNRDRQLDVGEEWQFTCERNLNASPGGSGPTNVVNTATVTGLDPIGTLVSDTATDDVDLYIPRIELVKLVDGQDIVTVSLTDPLTEVTYTYAATNTGNTPLASISLVDDTPPCVSPTLVPEVGVTDDGVMGIGETWNWTCTAAPAATVINTGTVSGTPLIPGTTTPFPDPNPVVTDADFAEVDIVDPDLELTKTVDRSVIFPGETVVYSYVAENTSVSPAIDLAPPVGSSAGWVTDDRCGPVTQTVVNGFNVGDVNSDALLNSGEAWQFTCTTALTQTTLNTADIVADVIIAGAPNGQQLERLDRAIVEVIIPEIALEKIAITPVVLDPDATPVLGPDVPDARPAQYLYIVTNPGSTPIRDVVVTDDRCAPLTYLSGDVGDDGILGLDEAWEYSCEQQLQREWGTPPPTGAESALVTNVATVTGTAFLPFAPETDGPAVSAEDSEQVLVIEPGLSLVKRADPTVVRPGDPVTYTFEVTNTGDVGLDPIGVIDDKCPDITYVSGDLDGNGFIDGANGRAVETWIYTCTRDVGIPPAPETEDVNDAAVFAFGPLGNVFADEATASVRVILPAIDLVKTVSETLVPIGTTVTYGFTVTNVGESPVAADDLLQDIELIDLSLPENPACFTPVFVGGDTNGNGALDREPAETWTYECQGAITEPTVDVAGVVGVAGVEAGLPTRVFARDAQFVQPFTPAIMIEKTADPTILTAPGGDVTYRYAVRNTGDVPLAGVADRIVDDTCAPVTYVEGDLDEDGLLDTPNSIFEDAGDETWIFECRTRVTETTVNTVVVTGTPVDPGGVELCAPQRTAPTDLTSARVTEPCDVDASDTALVEVVPPLPPTGTTVPWWALVVGGVLLLGGIPLWLWSRRRARTDG
jgi:uncharacterized repeat protein (TIGR01451 family)